LNELRRYALAGVLSAWQYCSVRDVRMDSWPTRIAGVQCTIFRWSLIAYFRCELREELWPL